MNANEKEFMEMLRDAEANISSDYEMEIDHFNGEDDTPSGWWVYKYNEARGEAVIADDPEPLITDEEAKAKRIDVVKCLNEYGCYYVA